MPQAQPQHLAADSHLSKANAQAAAHRRLLNSSAPAASTKVSTPPAATGNSTAGQNNHPATATKAPEPAAAAAAGPKNASSPQPAVKTAEAQGTPQAKLPVPAAQSSTVPKQQQATPPAAAQSQDSTKQQQATPPAAAHSQNSTKQQQAATVQNHGASSSTKPASAVAPPSTAQTPSTNGTQKAQDSVQQQQQPTPHVTGEAQGKPGKDIPSAPSTHIDRRTKFSAQAQTVSVQASITAATDLADNYEVVPESEQASVFSTPEESAQPANAADAAAEGVDEADAGAHTTAEKSEDWADSREDAGEAQAEGVDAQITDADTAEEEWHVSWTTTAATDDLQGDANPTDDYVDVSAESVAAAHSVAVDAEVPAAEADTVAAPADANGLPGTAQTTRSDQPAGAGDPRARSTTARSAGASNAWAMVQRAHSPASNSPGSTAANGRPADARPMGQALNPSKAAGPVPTSSQKVAARADRVAATLSTDATDESSQDLGWEAVGKAEMQTMSAEDVEDGTQHTQGQHEGKHSAAKLLLAASKTAADAFVATAASYRLRKPGPAASATASVASRNASPYSFLSEPEEDEDADAVSEWFRQNKIKPKVTKAKPYYYETPKEAPKKPTPQYQSTIISTTLYDVEPSRGYVEESEEPVPRQPSYERRREAPEMREQTYSRAELGYGSQSASNLARGAVSIVGDEKWRLINIEKEEDIRWLRAGVKEYNRNHKKPVFVLAWVP